MRPRPDSSLPTTLLRVALQAYEGPAWVAQAEVGTPGVRFKFLLDTGSPDTWLVGSGCDSKACALHTRYDAGASASARLVSGSVFSVNYASGLVDGGVVHDTLRFTNSTVEPVTVGFGRVQRAPVSFQKRFRWYPFDGVLGLGLSPPNRGAHRGAHVGRAVPTPIIDKLLSGSAPKHQRHIGDMPPGGLARLFSLHLGGGASIRSSSIGSSKGYDNALSEGSLLLGGIDSDLYEPPLVFYPLKRPALFWSTPIAAVRVGTASWCTDTGTAGDQPCTAVIDTGSSLMMVPRPMLSEIEGEIVVLPNCSGVDALPLLRISLNASHAYAFEPSDYVVRIPVERGSQDACFLGISAHDYPASMGNLWVFGSHILSKFYTVFDEANQRIGLALARRAS